MESRALLFLNTTGRAPGGASVVFDSSISLGVSGVAVEDSRFLRPYGSSDPVGWSIDCGSSGSVWVGLGLHRTGF